MELTPGSELTRRWWVLPCAVSCLSAEVEDQGRRLRPGGRGRGPGECLSHGAGAEAFPPFPGEGSGHMPGQPSLGRRAQGERSPGVGDLASLPVHGLGEQTRVDQPEPREREVAGRVRAVAEPRALHGAAAPVRGVVGIEEEAGRACVLGRLSGVGEGHPRARCLTSGTVASGPTPFPAEPCGACVETVESRAGRLLQRGPVLAWWAVTARRENAAPPGERGALVLPS